MEVRQNEDLTLTCIVSDAKPAAQIQWLRNNVEMKTGNSVLFRWISRISIWKYYRLKKKNVTYVIHFPRLLLNYYSNQRTQDCTSNFE